MRFINVSEWDSSKALDAACAHPEWRDTVQRFIDDPDMHVTARPAVYQVAADVRPREYRLACEGVHSMECVRRPGTRDSR